MLSLKTQVSSVNSKSLETAPTTRWIEVVQAPCFPLSSLRNLHSRVAFYLTFFLSPLLVQKIFNEIKEYEWDILCCNTYFVRS
jgi:hypothetical protein